MKFYETKHAGLVALNAGLVYASVSGYMKIEEYVYKPAILISVFCFGISIFCSFISNFMFTRKLFYKKKRIKDPNIYYYRHTSYLTNLTFNNELLRIDPNYIQTKLDNDMIDQIILFSRLTHSKFDFYRYAAFLTALGSALIGFSSIIKILISR